MDVGQESGIPGKGAAGGGVKGDKGCHHQSLVLIPWLVVNDDGVDGVSLNPGWPGAAHAGHGIEVDLIRVVGAFQRNLGRRRSKR